MLEELKIKLIKVAKEAEQQGLCKYKSGNFSIRDFKTNYIVITPSGIARYLLETDDICVLDLEGNIIEAKNGLKPSSEYPMHLEAYKCRNNISAIVHTHSKFATAFAVTKKEIPAVVSEAIHIFGNDGIIRIAPYKTPGTIELAKSIVDVISKYNVCLMGSHGVLTVSDSGIEDAFLKSQYVEEVAEIYYYALTIGSENNISSIIL